MPTAHKPVMLEEVLDLLAVKPGDIVLDGTVGGGSYTLALADRAGKTGKVIAIDYDRRAFEGLKERIAQNKNKNIIPVHENFRHLRKIIEAVLPGAEKNELAGAVFDLGLSSDQLEDRDLGLSFLLAAPLNMRIGGRGASAGDIINKRPEQELKRIIQIYGEEPRAAVIARKIASARREKRIETTSELAEIVREAVPRAGRRHAATLVFQALRIAVNRELDNLAALLPQIPEILRPGGRLAVISYHSLEDRLVKDFIKRESRDCVCPPSFPACACGHRASLKPVTKKPLRPSALEIASNSRARSAKLRVAEKI